MRSENRLGHRRPFLRGGLIFVVGVLILIATGLGIRALGIGEDGTTDSSPIAADPTATLGTTAPWSSDERAEDVVLPPAVEAEPTVADAEAAFRDKRYLDAFETYSAYVERNPEHAWGHTMVGMSAWKAGLPEEAEAGFRAALGRDPSLTKCRLNLARVVLELGRPGEALDLVTEAARREPRSSEVERMLGRVQHNLGDFTAAALAYRRAVALDPRDAWAMNNLGYLYLEQERFEEALPPLARAVEVAGTMPLFQNNLGIALERLGHFDEAAVAFRAALAADPGSDKASLNLSRVDGRPEDPGLPPVDLAEAASRFAVETAGLEAGRADASAVPPSSPEEGQEP